MGRIKTKKFSKVVKKKEWACDKNLYIFKLFILTIEFFLKKFVE